MIGAIFATDESWGFGHNNGMPWPANKDDFSHFKKVTMGSKIVMGRKTFESLPGILPGREHYVISNELECNGHGVKVYKTIPDLLNDIGSKFWVIGGASILNAFKDVTDFDIVYHTVIKGNYDHDVSLDGNFILEGLTEVDKVAKNGCEIYKYLNEN